ncbi:MAG: tRNA lysidine(34) synthetase TilS [Victivallales bacterium]
MTISDFFERNKPLESKKVFAGFSGGADSTALLLLLAEEADKRGFKLKAIHFEHGLRGNESICDANWCREFCEIRNIDYMKISLNVNAARHPGESTESAARRLRLREWEILAGNKSSLVALAHNANDKIENIFLRLLRGSNVSGLTSLREIQKIGTVTFIRPVLPYKRKEIEDFLRTHDVTDWRTDSSNAENRYRRNFFRNKIIPLISEKFPNADSSVLKSAHALEQDADFIEAVASGIFQSVKNRESIDTAYLKSMHPAILVRFLRYWISGKIKSDFIPDSEFMSRLNTELNRLFSRKSSDKQSVLLPLHGRSLFLCIKKENISFCKRAAKSTGEPQLCWKWESAVELRWRSLKLKSKTISGKTIPEFTRGENIVYLDAGLLPPELTVRNCRKGDVMVPFGKTARVHLKKLFESGKIPADRKKETPVVCTENGEIIWIPGVRRANFANIGSDTKRIAVLTSIDRNDNI